MKAAVFSRKNKAEQYSIQQVEKPVLKKNEVLIKIKAVSINAADYRSVQMHIQPKSGIMGADVSGIVEATGEDCHQFKPGDTVIGDLATYGFGGLAEYAVAPEKLLVIKPEQLSFDDAATLPIAGVTALQALRNKGKIQKGQKVLIVGSGGGVGTMAVQLAKHFGAEVDAVCGPNNVTQSKALGANKVFDYSKEDFTKSSRRYDLIIAANGNKKLSAYKKILTSNGIYVMVGGAMSQIFSSLLLGWIYSLGKKKITSLAAKANTNDLTFLASLVVKGDLKPVIDRSYAFEQTNEAMNYISAGHARGKVVVKID